MKHLIYTTVIITIFSSCKKHEVNRDFTSNELDFVNYSQGQAIKFIDTNFITYSLSQTLFEHDFRQFSVIGGTRYLGEYYEVSYSNNVNATTFNYNITLRAASRPSMEINFNNYGVAATPDSLNAVNSIIINGMAYNNVYSIKVYKQNPQFNSNDSATLYSNKQFGIIQLLFPDGKRIVRTN